MNEIMKKYPFPISGLILGMFALGNLVRSYGEIFRSIIGLVAGVLLILLIIKILTATEEFKEAMKNPVIAGTLATFPMALMVGSTYISVGIGKIIWFLGIILHIALILYFVKTFVLNFKINTVFTTWFIVFVGIVVASVTAPVYKMQSFGQIAFWFGLVSYLVLLPIVAYRVFIVKNIPEPALPTLVVFAAPGSLLLAGYMASFSEKNISLSYFLVILSSMIYIYSVIVMISQLKLKFYPSYSAYTFPIVISALGMKLFTGFAMKAGIGLPILPLVVKIEEIIAIIIVIYVLVKYLQFLFQSNK